MHSIIKHNPWLIKLAKLVSMILNHKLSHYPTLISILLSNVIPEPIRLLLHTQHIYRWLFTLLPILTLIFLTLLFSILCVYSMLFWIFASSWSCFRLLLFPMLLCLRWIFILIVPLVMLWFFGLIWLIV